MRDEELLKDQLAGLSKKEIEDLAKSHVNADLDEGLINPVHEIVHSNRLAAYFTAKVSALRSACLDELGGLKEITYDTSVVSKMNAASQWNFNDPYLAELETETKLVKEKCKLSSEKDRYHITLGGEPVTLKKGIKTEGGETVKIAL